MAARAALSTPSSRRRVLLRAMFASRIVSYAFMAMGTASSGALDGWSAVGTNALFAHFIGDEIGSHAIWISSFAYYVYHLVQWPFEKRDEDGRRPKPGKYLLTNLIFPLVLWTLTIGCVRML